MSKINRLSRVIGITSLTLIGAFTPFGIAFQNSSTSALIPVSIGGELVANASEARYRPPANRERIQRTEGGGSRGCDRAMPASLNLLTPKDHIAQTTSAHPTFMWHVSDKISNPMVFTLTEKRANKPLFQTTARSDKSGIVRVTIPESEMGLKENTEYRWTVAIICNEQRPSDNIYARAWIERIASNSELENRLARASSDSDRAAVYAESGIWYDAIAILARARTSDREAFNSFLSLLEQVGLNKIAASERQQVVN